MAAPDLSTNLQEEATCAICLDYFTDPCIRRCWGQPEGPCACPACRELFPQRNLRPNRPLAKMAEMARRLHPPSPVPEGVCPASRWPPSAATSCAFCARPASVQGSTGRTARARCRTRPKTLRCGQSKLEKSLERLWKQVEDVLLPRRRRPAPVAGRWPGCARLLVEEEQLLLQRLEEEELEVLPPLRESTARLGQQSAQLPELITELEGLCQ
ncbi:hypothetical protein FD755_025601, partial [Muntiacus reevesi]